jgi:hypothetical protein
MKQRRLERSGLLDKFLVLDIDREVVEPLGGILQRHTSGAGSGPSDRAGRKGHRNARIMPRALHTTELSEGRMLGPGFPFLLDDYERRNQFTQGGPEASRVLRLQLEDRQRE